MPASLPHGTRSRRPCGRAVRNLSSRCGSAQLRCAAPRKGSVMTVASRASGLLLTMAALVAGMLVITAATARAGTVVAAWNMEDAGGTMADSSGRGHTGTLHGVTARQPGQSGFGYG